MSKLLPALCALAGHLPLGMLQRTGAVAGWLGLRVSKRFARLTGTNLEQAGLAANPRDYKHLVATSAAQTGMGAMELAIAWGRDVDGIARLVRRCEGWEAVEASLAAGRGLLFVTPHLGAYDIAGRYLASRLPFPLTAMYRPPKLAWLEPMMQAGRVRGNGRTAPATPQGVRQVMKALRSGEATIVLPDQVPGQGEGVWVPFFGRWAYTMTLVARPGEMKNVDTFFFYGHRLGVGEGFEVRIRPLSEPFTGDKLADARRVNAEVEALIREAPEQYLWSYNRFKHPAGAELPPTVPVSEAD